MAIGMHGTLQALGSRDTCRWSRSRRWSARRAAWQQWQRHLHQCGLDQGDHFMGRWYVRDFSWMSRSDWIGFWQMRMRRAQMWQENVAEQQLRLLPRVKPHAHSPSAIPSRPVVPVWAAGFLFTPVHSPTSGRLPTAQGFPHTPGELFLNMAHYLSFEWAIGILLIPVLLSTHTMPSLSRRRWC